MRSPLVTQQLSLQIQASFIFCLLVTLLHGAAGLGLWLLGLPGYWTAALGFTLLTSWLAALLQNGLRCGPSAITGLRLEAGGWSLTTGQDAKTTATLLAGQVVLSWLVVMHFETSEGRRMALALLPDSLPAQSFRHVRALLRLGLVGSSD
ncbi:MAG: hypothetical protein QNL99_16060 [SAR86 cluster bacterium]|jgi:hypothetical protein|uniref:Toxin CptA n=1 Tax=SAR86 cluster bacterium TaxID=2030880 RepID=A0A972VY82_9GAMM|nr:hypothetical protein [SAR86 cluster bacterium]|tara:strand:- start:2580 stop:3029 length:450 start_codon:yes stop_codon:yes gene_type:complete